MDDDRYWIVEWRFPASLGKPPSEWQAVNSPPCRHLELAKRYPQREYYDYRISEFVRAERVLKGAKR